MHSSIQDVVSAGSPLAAIFPTHDPGSRIPAATEFLDDTHDALLDGNVHAAMNDLRTGLWSLRQRLTAAEWTAFGEEARRHPLHVLLLESPFTQRAYAKPRGYAGDAVMMDMVYGKAQPAADLSALGGMLYGYEFDSPCFKSVRTRRAIVAQEIDDVASSTGQAHVVAVASGHLREVEWSRAARRGAVSITAIDQDRKSLEVIDEQYRSHGATTVPGSVGDLLRRSLRVSDADLVYAAGLYDYLADDVARALTDRLFRTLRSGGRLLIANFTPATRDAAYMEAFMDWQLIYRTPESMPALTETIPQHDVAAIEQFSDANDHVTYMRVIKR
jgi:extracellular factor (EF) 3-hydroxypalmitic acid methyl ester biosynthesis protein